MSGGGGNFGGGGNYGDNRDRYSQQNIEQNPSAFRETVTPGVRVFGQSLGISLGFLLGIVLVFVFVPMLLCGGCFAMAVFVRVADDSTSHYESDWDDGVDNRMPQNSRGGRRDSIQDWQNSRSPSSPAGPSYPSHPTPADSGPKTRPDGGIDSSR